MVKTKFKLDLLKHAGVNEYIVKAVTSHNEGKVVIDLRDFMSFGTVLEGVYPAAYKHLTIEVDETEENKLIVSESEDKTVCLTIEEIIVHELETI